MALEKTVGSFVREYVRENGRGCPKYLLQASGYSAKAITAALEAKVIEAGRGREGGLYPYGEKPEPKTDGASSLRSEMRAWMDAALLGTINREVAESLFARLDEESKRRSDARTGE